MPRPNPTPQPPATPPPATPPQVPIGGAWTVYNPTPGSDPDWDAYMATFTAQVAQRNAEAAMARNRLQTEYDAGVAQLDYQAPGARKDLEASMLSRGVGRSGEAVRRAGELESDIYSQRAAADRARLEGYQTIDQGLTGNLTDLAAQREAAIADSRLRLLTDGKKVGAAETPGVGTSDPYRPSTKKKVARGGGSAAPPPAPPAGQPSTRPTPPDPNAPPTYGKPKPRNTSGGGGNYYS